MWRCTPIRDLDPISACCLDNQDGRLGENQLRLKELEALDDKRLQAQQQIELYQAQISRAFNKKVREWIFKEGDLVLAVRRPMVMKYKTKEKF